MKKFYLHKLCAYEVLKVLTGMFQSFKNLCSHRKTLIYHILLYIITSSLCYAFALAPNELASCKVTFRALQDAVEDFETIRAMDEEILETQKIVERDLRQEYEAVSSKVIEV